jgi:O-antigen ligase
VSSVGRALFLAGIFLMVTGDWPQSTLLPGRWVVPLPVLAWPWLYLMLFAAAVVVLTSTGVLRVADATSADFLHTPIALLTAAFLLSVAFSQVPDLSAFAFGCVLAVVGFSLAVARLVEDEAGMAGIAFVIPAAALCLALRVIVWRFDEGLTTVPDHVRNNAWLGKIQISWVLNLLAPLLLGRFLAARGGAAILFYGGTWLLTGVAISVLFSRAGVLAFLLATLTLCAVNARYWRRSLPVLVGGIGLALGLMAASTKTPSDLVHMFLSPARYGSLIDRQSAMRQSLRMIADHSLVGIGLGTYDDIAHSRYGPIADPWFFRRGWHAHNTLLHILSETGAVGFLAWCYLWFVIVRFLLRRWRTEDIPGRLNSSAVLCVLLAFFVLAMTESVTAARLHASLRMNLTVALLVIYGIRLSARSAPAPNDQRP